MLSSEWPIATRDGSTPASSRIAACASPVRYAAAVWVMIGAPVTTEARAAARRICSPNPSTRSSCATLITAARIAEPSMPSCRSVRKKSVSCSTLRARSVAEGSTHRPVHAKIVTPDSARDLGEQLRVAPEVECRAVDDRRDTRGLGRCAKHRRRASSARHDRRTAPASCARFLASTRQRARVRARIRGRMRRPDQAHFARRSLQRFPSRHCRQGTKISHMISHLLALRRT